MRRRRSRFLPALLVTCLALVGSSRPAGAGFVLSDNTSSSSGGTDAATGSTWLADSFGSGTTASTLNSITLSLANPTAGTAILSLYSDGGLQPGSLLGNLTAPGQYSTGLGLETFTTTGIALTANTTYWVVLSASTGEYDWSYSSTTTGSGVGFQEDYAQSPDKGSSWFYYADAPYQMTVTASISPSVVPEPGSLVLCGLGAATLLICRGRRPNHARNGDHPSPC